jgi:hypothetical protein
VREVLRSNNPVLLSFAEAQLREAGIEPLLLDGFMSVLEGSLGVLPRRLLVPDDDIAQARRVLAQAGLGEELKHER